MNDVIAHKDCIPFVRYRYGIGRTGQAKKYGQALGRWPQKAVKIVLALLINAESNAKQQGMDTSNLVVSHVQVNRAPKMRRRTYRAHGRINKYESSPSHIQLILAEKAEQLAAGQGKVAKKIDSKNLEAGATAQ